MSDDNPEKDKPVTLADYIPPAAPITPERRKAARDSLSSEDRARLEELERAVRDTEPDAIGRSRKGRASKRKKSRANETRKIKNSKMRTFVFFVLVVLFFIVFVLD
jgi:hypothetical protein